MYVYGKAGPNVKKGIGIQAHTPLRTITQTQDLSLTVRIGKYPFKPKPHLFEVALSTYPQKPHGDTLIWEIECSWLGISLLS